MGNKEEKIISEIAKIYHRMLRKNNFFPSYNQELEFYDSIACACREHYPWEVAIKGIETSYFKLPFHHRKIIKHEYFYNNCSFWWEAYFTRKQYSTFKKEALNDFIKYLKQENIINNKGEINVPSI